MRVGLAITVARWTLDVHLYPLPLDGVDVRARSWVRRTRADLDEPLRRAVRAWLDGPDWPFERIDFAAG